MQGLDKSNRDFSYVRSAILMFMLRTCVLGFALYKGPYFSCGRFTTFHVFAVFLDVINIFQFIFIFSVIQKKNLFQFIMYICLLLYSLLFTLMMMRTTYTIHGLHPDADLKLGFSFLIAYIAVLIFEVVVYIFMYIKLRRDTIWSNFKKIGANPITNEAFKRREELNAVLRLTIMFLCIEIINLFINLEYHTVQHVFSLVTLVLIFFIMSIFPNKEYVLHRKILLAFAMICIIVGLIYFILDTIHYLPYMSSKTAWVLESLFYMFNMIILFNSALKDYRMFGSGLRNYYFRECNEERRGIQVPCEEYTSK